MGDRYTIKIKCANCKTINDHFHSTSCCLMSFVCKKCKKTNWVSVGFVSKIVSKKEEEELYKLYDCE